MFPPKTEHTDFEKLAIGEFIIGKIAEVQYDLNHSFKGFGDKPDAIKPAVRFVFEFEGYQYHHFSRWLKFTTAEKSNLYKKYISKLVEGVEPDCQFDLDILKGMAVKTIWVEENDYQNIESIFPVGEKIPATSPVIAPEEEDEGIDGGDAI